MYVVDPKQIDYEYRQLAGAVRRWEDDPSSAMARALHMTSAQTQGQLDSWERAGAWEGTQMKLLRDQVSLVAARIELAQQLATRGY